MGVTSPAVLDLKNALKSLEVDDFLIPTAHKFDIVLDRCIKLLVMNDYVVIKKPKAVKIIKDIKGLVGLYYFLLQQNYPKIKPYRDDKADWAIAKALVTRIKESSGFNDDDALIKATQIVEGLFIFKESMGIRLDVLASFKVFGQAEMGWVTKKVIELLNKSLEDEVLLSHVAEEEAEAYAKRKKIEFGYKDI